MRRVDVLEMGRIRKAFLWIGALAATVLTDGLASNVLAAPLLGRPALSAGNDSDSSSNELAVQSAATPTSAEPNPADEGFGPASLDGEEASRRYGIWGGVLP